MRNPDLFPRMVAMGGAIHQMRRKELTTGFKFVLYCLALISLACAWRKAQEAHRAELDRNLPVYNAEGKRLR